MVESMSTSKRKHLLLTNHLRHATTHNKAQEEREMWRLHTLEERSSLQRELQSSLDFNYRTRERVSITRGRLLSDTNDFSGGIAGEERRDTSSYYWTRQLMKAEEADTHRWGHAGYKELHQNEFKSTDEDDKPEDGKRKRRRRKKHKKESKMKLTDEDSCDDEKKSSVEHSKGKHKKKKKKHKSKGI